MKYFRIISTLFVIGLGLSLIACSQTIKSLDKQFNRVKAEPPLFCSKDNPCQEAKQFHKTLFVADLHADSLLLGRDLIEKSDAGLVDIPRLIKGNVAIQVFGVVTRYSVQDIQSSGSTGSRNPSKINDGCGDDLITLRAKFPDWPKDTEKSLLARSLHQAAMLHTFEIRSEILTDRKYPIKQFRIIKSQMDLNEYLKARKSYPGITHRRHGKKYYYH